MRLALIGLLLVAILAAGGNHAAADGNESPLLAPDDLAAIINVRSVGDIRATRQRLIDLLWCGALPAKLPTVDTIAHSTEHAARVERVEVMMDFGLRSVGRIYTPYDRNNRLVIYHHGHAQPVGTSPALIDSFLVAGFDVAEFAMPGVGENIAVWADDPDYGRVYIREHSSFALLKPPCGHPLRYFLEPVVVLLNHADGYEDIATVGLSGGGWTTTLVAAIDTRIDRSFPVAGSLPMYLRQGNPGDWEQTTPEVYRIAEYMELYIMATDQGRRQLQILNRFDPCCFRGQLGESYAATVAGLAEGGWALWVDDSHKQHAVSSAAVGRILAALGEPLPDVAVGPVWLPLVGN